MSDDTTPSSPSASPVPASIPIAGDCGYYYREWACREGGYLWDADGDGYDPSDVTHACPSCNTRQYLIDGVDQAQNLNSFNGMYASGAEQFRHRMEMAIAANPRGAAAILEEIGPVVCTDWLDPEAPHFDYTVDVIENAQAIETRSAKTEGLGPKDESAVGNADASNPTPDEIERVVGRGL